MDMPVYLFTGFLEGGKTKFIQETMEDKRFNSGEKILMLVCENGVEQYDVSRFASGNVDIVNIKDESELSTSNFVKWEREHKPEKVVIEYNGMWLVDSLYEKIPDNWLIYQEMCFLQEATFMPYNANMRQLMFDKLKGAELVVLNRASKKVDKEAVHKIVRAASKRAQIAYEYTDGTVEYDDIKDPLPYDINADVIEIKDEDYAEFYRDFNEESDKYIGKTLKFKAICLNEANMPDNIFLAGRHIMTCCEADIEFYPLVCLSDDKSGIKSRDWRMITGKLVKEKNKMFKGKGPVLHVQSVSVTTPPKPELATFY
ncbi:MAG: GTPase [Firmicutes bacterium]|nr:GTPase [Bacillota bacterium]